MIVPLFPAPEWELKAFLRGVGNIDLEAEPDEPNHVFVVGADETAGYAVGVYTYTLRAFKDNEVAEIDSGFVKVLPDIAALQDPFDPREEARITLDMINLAIQKKLTKDQQRYVIETHNGRREIWRMEISDLIKLKSQYEAKVARLDAAQKGKGVFNTSLKIRFR